MNIERLSISIHVFGDYAAYFQVGDKKLPFQLIYSIVNLVVCVCVCV